MNEESYNPEQVPFAFAFKDQGKVLLQVSRDGRIFWYGDQNTAIKAFWDTCEKMNPLRARVEELEERIRDMGLVP